MAEDIDALLVEVKLVMSFGHPAVVGGGERILANRTIVPMAAADIRNWLRHAWNATNEKGL